MSNNASNNDKMIENLADRLDNFPGAANQTRCFLHILNLTAKSVIKQFEVPKKKLNEAGQDENDFGEAVDALQALSAEIEDDEPSDFDNDEEAKDDDDEGLEDERQGMTGRRGDVGGRVVAGSSDDDKGTYHMTMKFLT